ncbi:hypothetical protein BV25DRAFT_1989632 [Artomyces pyxidatus]|uniref:Uncharacterized protein n=1 Tax=Artomyces pyxidatus TaxID=48021 RepID=A0ACB8T9M1_9AGAM|nr:hypothetical protein BV25DRAFT_1989632 [Artomyces pyxidatus]
MSHCSALTLLHLQRNPTLTRATVLGSIEHQTLEATQCQFSLLNRNISSHTECSLSTCMSFYSKNRTVLEACRSRVPKRRSDCDPNLTVDLVPPLRPLRSTQEDTASVLLNAGSSANSRSQTHPLISVWCALGFRPSMPPCPYRPCYPHRQFETDGALLQHALAAKRTHPCCIACERVFVDEEAAAQHREAKHTLPCHDCGLKFRSEAALDQHERTSHARPYCSRCKKCFSEEADLELHNIVQHPVIRCGVCGIIEEDDLESHYRASSNHPRCTQCQVGFLTTSHFNEHCSAVHPAVRLRCPICLESFASLQALEAHNAQRAIHPTCGFCGGLFKDAAALTEHEAHVHFLERIRASTSQVSEAMDASALTLRPIRSTERVAPDAAPQHPLRSLAVGAERRRANSEASPTSLSDTCTGSIISLSTPMVSSFDMGTMTSLPESESGSEPRGASSDVGSPSAFCFSFHPTWEPQAIHSPSAKRHGPLMLSSPAVRKSSASPAQDDVRANKFDWPLTPSPLRTKGPLADAPSFPFSSGYPLASHRPAEPVGPASSACTPPKMRGGSAADSPVAATSKFYCRICRADPCRNITATVCGHVFCYGCIVEELKRSASCPVCKSAVLLFTLLRLDLNDTY